ncbi:hypothetical protein D3C80_847370 [compost metagenome]
MNQPVLALGQAFGVGVDQLDAVDFRHHARVFTHGTDADGAIGADFDLLLGRDGDRAAVAKHRHTVASTQYPESIDVQTTGTHIRFAAIWRLHGDKTVTAHSHIQVTAGFHHRAFTEVGAWALGHGKGTRRKAVTEHRHRARLLQVTLKTIGRNVGQVVGMSLLRQRVLASPGHGHIKHLVHNHPPLHWRPFAVRRCSTGAKASSEPTC